MPYDLLHQVAAGGLVRQTALAHAIKPKLVLQVFNQQLAIDHLESTSDNTPMRLGAQAHLPQ